MPLTRRALALAAEPASVPVARAWVTGVITEIGRDELVPAAQLGVSELVTNAILHARPPLTVAVRGTVEHPRVEVVDHAPGPIRPHELMLVDDEPATFGRGLAMLAMNAHRWGSETLPDGLGKRVWFEPAERMNGEADLSAMFADVLDEISGQPVPAPADSLQVVLRQVPVRVLGQLRRYHAELRRELRLLALADPDRHPLAVRLTDLFTRTDATRSASSGLSGLDDAIERGLTTVDVELAVPADGPALVVELSTLLDRLYAAYADEYLLAMAPPPELQELQTWYFGQILAQSRGEEPEAWSGACDLRTSDTG